jgi:alkylation response protein AidB-like acyl-CoA dehydrogenase
MVARRGYRVELGEIEAGLYRHPNVKEAAVVAFADEQEASACRLPEQPDEKPPSLIAIKRFCSENLPLYMIPDKFQWFESPQDVDRQDRLSALEGNALMAPGNADDAERDALVDFNFSSEQKLLRDSIVKFARGEPDRDVIERDRTHTFSRDIWKQCAAVGLLGLLAPEDYGGANLDRSGARSRSSARVRVPRRRPRILDLRPCARVRRTRLAARQREKDRYLGGCWRWWVPRHHQAIPVPTFAMKMRAERADGGWRLNGTNVRLQQAGSRRRRGVRDHRPGEEFPRRRHRVPGRARRRQLYAGQRFAKMGLRTSAVGELVFENALLRHEAVLGTVGGGSTVFGTDGLGARCSSPRIGTIERLLETSITYARTQFGQTIGKFQAVAHKIADMKVQLEAARLLVHRTASRLTVSRSIGQDAAIAKLFVSESLVKAAIDTVQLHGGYGFMEEYEVERARAAIGATLYSARAKCSATSSGAGWGCRVSRRGLALWDRRGRPRPPR